MRSTLHFAALLTIGVLAGALLDLLTHHEVWPMRLPSFKANYPSLALGVGLGLSLGALSRVSWPDLARHLARGLIETWKFAGWAAVGCAIVFVFLMR